MTHSKLTLVTGATGNLGNAIVKQLVQQGRTVRCLVRDLNVAKEILPSSVQLFHGDLTDQSTIQLAMKGVKTVYHAGGMPEQWQKDVGIFKRVNTLGTKYLIEAALKENTHRFIYTSTQDVFDLTLDSFDETTIHSRWNCSPYEHSKLLAQDLIDQAVKEQGLPAISLHPVAIYGPCVSKPTGLTRLIDELRTNKIPVLLNGGLPVVFNEDAARAHILAEKKASIGTKYLLTDKFYTLKEIASIVHDLHPQAKVPMLMPDIIANSIAYVGEPIAKLTGKPPLITKSELKVLRRKGKPNGRKIRIELEWKTTSFKIGLEATLKSLASLTY